MAGINFNTINNEGIYVSQDNYPPIPVINYHPTEPKVGDIVTFDASLSEDPDGTIISYKWDFGDGYVSNDVVTNHSFNWGDFNVTLTAIDNEGKSWNSNVIISPIDNGVPKIIINKPEENFVYLFNRKIMPFSGTVAIGNINIEVDALDEESGIKKVEFYIDDLLEFNDTERPYEWLWKGPSISNHTIKVVATDLANNIAIANRDVWTFNL